MKKIRFSTLNFQQGNSDKVYEVDLIERMSRESERYLVNFRYGRTGSKLREGTKTTQPVSLDQAEQLFISVIVSKINKGYQVTAGENPLAEDVGEKLDTPVSDDADNINQQQVVYRRFLENRDDNKQADACNRTIWRLGELAMIEAGPALLETLQKTKPNAVVRTYSLLWTLGRIKEHSAFEVINHIASSQKKQAAHVRRMALHAAWHLLPEAKQSSWLDEHYQTLPESLRAIAECSDAHQAQALLAWAQTNKSTELKRPDLCGQWFVCLYLKAKSNSPLRQSLLTLCRITPMTFGSMWLIRLFLKIAEFELDAPLFAMIAMRIESTRANDPIWGRNVYENKTWQRSGREYFRLRGWRSLRRLGELNDANFVPLAAALLQQYDDKDSRTSSITKYLWDGGYQAQRYSLGLFNSHLAYNQLLYRHSESCQPTPTGKQWNRVNAQDDEQRVEAFAHLWDQQPHAFVDCLTVSRSQAVHHFALRGLRTHPAIFSSICVNDWVRMFCCPFSDSVAFAREQLEKNHASALMDMAVLRKLLNAETTGARRFVHEQLSRVSDDVLLASVDWHVDIITSHYADNYEQSKQYHSRYARFSEKQQVLLGKLVSYAQAITGDNLPEGDALQSIHWHITEPLAETTKTLSYAVIADLIKHPVIEVQRLGAAILVARKDNPSDLPEAIFLALIESKDPEIRAAGVNLLGNMTDAELVEMSTLLVSLLISVDELVRIEARKIIQRIAKSNSSFANDVLLPLVDQAFKAEPVEGAHEQLVECVAHDLSAAWSRVDKNQLWRLLMAQSRTAQRVGATILQPRAYTDYTVKQWARLGKHVSKTTRQWAREAYTHHVLKVRDDLSSGLRLLDTGWNDTRHFALDYFRNNMSERDWSEDHLIFLCDSTRDDVQRLGRELLRAFFKEEQGERYLLKLSQHPSRNVQLFATEFLQAHAAGKPAVIRELNQYFITVLSSVNQARVAKDRVMAFLMTEAQQDDVVAEQLSELLAWQSVTIAIQDKAGFIQAMLLLQQQYPALELPLKSAPLPIRGAQPEVV